MATRTRVGALVAAGLMIAALLAGTAGAAGRTRPASDCQPFAKTPCLLPFPNNLFTVRDRSTATGLRLNLPARVMPVNSSGQRISVAEYNRNDGFSPGSAMIVHVPGLDNPRAFARTHPVGVLNLSHAFARNAPIVVIDERTGARQLIFAQLDANATSPQTRNLMILPAKALTEGHTYVVALRNLRDAAGRTLKAPAWFEKLRDGRALPGGALTARSLRQDLRLAPAGQDRPGQPLRGVGLHRRLQAEPERAAAVDSQRRVRPARGPQPGRREAPGTGTGLQRDRH